MKLFKYELNRLFRQKTFYVFLGICLALTFVAFVTMKLIYQASVEAGEPLPYTALALTKNAVSSSLIVTLSAIFVAIFVTEEYQSGTIKTVLSKGYSNGQVFLAKYLVSLLASLIFTVLAIAITFLFSSKEFELGQMDVSFFASLLAQLILVIAYHSIYFSISVCVRKLGISIALNILGPSMVTAVLGMGDAFLHTDSFKLSDYWIDSFLKQVSQQSVKNSMILISILFGLICSAVAIVLGAWINKKKEL